MTPWIAFNAAVLAVLAIDLGLFNRKAHAPSVKGAATWTVVWVALALAFAAGMFFVRGSVAGTEFVTGYLIEYSLSVDNIFVIVLIFSFFGIKGEYQHRVLFWGIIGALIMRGAMIGAGAALIHRFEWISLVFGAFLVFTGIRMALGGHENMHPEKNPVLLILRKIIPVSSSYEGRHFFTQAPDEKGVLRRMATPLFVALIVIETMDLVFAVDSIPAVFAVTREPFIVYTSNIAAILGLRSLYFLLSGAVTKLRFLRFALAIILAFVGAKMLLAKYVPIPTLVSLGVIFATLAIASIASVMADRRDVTG